VDGYLGAVIEALKIEAGDAGGLARHHTTWILWRDILRACRFGWDLGRPAGGGAMRRHGNPSPSCSFFAVILWIAPYCSALLCDSHAMHGRVPRQTCCEQKPRCMW
jgi:hypothetical protein